MASVRKASIEAQVRELMADAQAAYRKPRVSFLQIELNLKLSRFLAGLRGFDAKKVAPGNAKPSSWHCHVFSLCLSLPHALRIPRDIYILPSPPPPGGP